MEAQTKRILREVADMIIFKILAAPLVVALTLLALVLFIGGQTLGGVVFLVLAFLVSPFGIPAIADWLMDRLYSLKYSLQSFITG